MYPALLFITSIIFVVASLELDSPTHPSRHRVLKATRRHSDSVRRSNDISFSRAITLAYVEDVESSINSPRFTSELRVQADRPVLFLEEYDHLLDDIDCDGNTMSITFRDAETYRKARTACGDLENGLVISSHASCSDEGTHAVFSVLDTHFDDTTSRIDLDLESSTLQEAFTHKIFTFGRTNEPYVIHQHNRLSRRNVIDDIGNGLKGISQDIGGGIEDGIDKAQHLLNTIKDAIDKVLPEVTDTSNGTSLRFSKVNESFNVPGDPFELGCNNCSGKGELVLRTAKIEFLDPKDVIDKKDLIKSGFLEVDLMGVKMSIVMRAAPTGSAGKDFTILSLPIVGITIPNVVSMGLSFELGLQFEAVVDSGVELGFGFDVVLPNTTLRIDIGNTSNSLIEGFNPSITNKPFSTNSSNIDVFLRAGFTQKLPVGFDFALLDSIAFPIPINKLDVTPFLSLPNFSINLTHPSSNSTGANGEPSNSTSPEFRTEFPDLTHIVYEVGVGAGVDAVVKKTLAATSLPIATQCLVSGPTGMVDAQGALAEFLVTHTPEPTSTSTSVEKLEAKSAGSNSGGQSVMAHGSWGFPLALVWAIGMALVVL